MNYLWLICLLALVLGGCMSQPKTSKSLSTEYRVMTFNIRYGTADDGPNHWSLRRESVAKAIKAFSPDLLGTQETLLTQRNYLAKSLPRYGVCGVGRDDGKDAGEMSAIFYRRDRFKLIKCGHFWLSPTPDVIASVGWDAALTRMATWIKVRDKSDPKSKPILFINAHLDHRGQIARTESAKLIRAKAIELGENCRVIITGDFNCTEDDPAYAALVGEDFVDSYRQIHPKRSPEELTFQGFHDDRTRGSRIDWIMTDRSFTSTESEIDSNRYDNRLASDHFPVTAILTTTRDK